MADIVTWSDFRLDPSYHNHAFFEHEDWGGGRSHFPFVHPKLLRLAIHLPHWLKRRRGQNKWIWRVFASRYLGRDVAFRRKYSFPMPTAAWLSAAPQLIRGGFLEDLLCAKVGDLFEAMAPDNPSRWTLVNVESVGPAALLEGVARASSERPCPVGHERWRVSLGRREEAPGRVGPITG